MVKICIILVFTNFYSFCNIIICFNGGFEDATNRHRTIESYEYQGNTTDIC